jgi:hypothetical protein
MLCVLWYSSRQPFLGTRRLTLPLILQLPAFIFQTLQIRAGPNSSNPFTEKTFQYAVPVTIESFGKGFVAHHFWAPRYWILQLRTFRWALYTLENPQSPSRRLVRRFPAEIITIIVQLVKEAAIEQGFRDCEQRMGVLKSSADLEIEEGLARLEKLGRLKGNFILKPIDDVVCRSNGV